MTKKKVGPKLSRESLCVLNAFDAAAMDWGWTEEQGTAEASQKSEHDYVNAKERLHDRLLKLETELSRWQAYDTRSHLIARLLKLETELNQCKEILKCEGFPN